MKGGFGTASLDLGDGLLVGAAVVTNAIGGIHDPETGTLVAGPLEEDGRSIVDSLTALVSPDFRPPKWMLGENSTIGVVATNARLDPGETNTLAAISHNGLAMAIRPVHTEFDGDTMFSLATRKCDASFDMIRLGAAVVVATVGAILGGVRGAVGLFGIPAVSELERGRNVRDGGPHQAHPG